MSQAALLTAGAGTAGLFAGVTVVLILASAVGATLKHSLAHGKPHPVIDNLNARVNAWWVMIAAIAVAFAIGPLGATALFLGVSYCALREFVTVLPTRRSDHAALAIAFFVALPIQYGLIAAGALELFSLAMPLLVLLGLPLLTFWKRESKLSAGGSLAHCATLQCALLICIYALSHVPALTMLGAGPSSPDGLALIAFLVIVVQGSDVLQYVWGKLLGRHRVAPRLSPAKTWEGLVGGVICASALGTALHHLTPFSPWQAGAVSLLLCLLGFAGGLLMSGIKRARGVKDWGAMIEGHGGMLDRVDSLIFSAPVFFYLIKFVD